MHLALSAARGDAETGTMLRRTVRGMAENFSNHERSSGDVELARRGAAASASASPLMAMRRADARRVARSAGAQTPAGGVTSQTEMNTDEEICIGAHRRRPRRALADEPPPVVAVDESIVSEDDASPMANDDDDVDDNDAVVAAAVEGARVISE